jgi:hypothetical protein
MFRMADCAAIVNELDEVDWFSLFSGKRMDYCVDLVYEMVWSCFKRHVPMRFSRDGRKLPWIFLLTLYNEHMLMIYDLCVPFDAGPDLVRDDPPFGAL